jgi:prepilin-type N-terminal cleavage/methylation domain-containing protein
MGINDGKAMQNIQIQKQLGFTLVELSIVIIIIGFLIAGVSAGSSLIKAAKINTVINEVTEYQTAIKTFFIKYGYLPGDFPNAAAYFGCTNSAAPLGCNGDGDGIVTYGGSAVGQGVENFRFWQHLSLANIVSGNYPGIVTVDDQADIGVNVPQSRAFSNCGYYVLTESYSGLGWGVYTVPPGLYITLGGFQANSNNADNCLSPNDVANIDRKIDDGMPHQGNVASNESFRLSGYCDSDPDDNAATYLNSDSIGCRVGFYTGY